MKKKLISGIIVTMFLVTMITFAIPVRVSAFDDDVSIGLVGPMGWLQWDGIKEGAQLARDLINDAGGIKSGGSTYRVVLVEIDEHVVPTPDPTAAVTDMLAALEDNPDMNIVIGGFRTECVLPLREAMMDYAAAHTPHRPIWFICGASEDYIIDCGDGTCGSCVRCDYERYKYMYRMTPINSSSLGDQLGSLIAQYIVPKLTAIFGEKPLPAYFIAEDLIWCREIVEKLTDPAIQSLLGINYKGIARPSAIETDFSAILDAIEGSGARMVVHVFSAVAGATFIKQLGERKVAAVPVGINVEGQLQQYWAETGGKCDYETIMAAGGTRTMICRDAEPLNSVEFWDEYVKRYGHSPIYTAYGSYGAIMGLNESAAYADWVNMDCDTIITDVLSRWGEEEIDGVHTRPGLQGWFKFTDTHDVWQHGDYSFLAVWPSRDMGGYDPNIEPYVRALLPQWQAGKLQVVWPRGHWRAASNPEPLPFAVKWKIPPWVYSLAETDFAGGTPIPHITLGIAEAMGADPNLVGYFGSFPAPDGEVGTEDIGTVTQYWQDTTPWTVLEADMDGNQFIDIDDVARVALDWGKTGP